MKKKFTLSPGNKEKYRNIFKKDACETDKKTDKKVLQKSLKKREWV